MRAARWFAILVLLAAGCGTVPHQYPREAGRTLATPDGGGERTLLDRIVVMHVHTRHSHDSDGRLDDVLRGAREARVHAVIVTDHNNMALAPQEGMHGDILLLVGSELSTRSGHLLVLGTSGLPDRKALMDDLLAEVERLGGVALVAHPFGPSAPWRDRSARGFAGIEVYNVWSDVADEAPVSMALSLLLYPMRPGLVLESLVDRPSGPLALWDVLLQGGPVVGVAGTDAHGPRLRLSWRTVDSYTSTFRLVRNHVLVERLDGPSVQNAIRDGRLFIGFDAWGDTSGFLFEAVTPDGRTAMCGEAMTWVPGMRINVSAPRRGRVRVFRDGRVVFHRTARHVSWEPPGPGVYRVEVALPTFLGLAEVPWIIANPIRLE